MWAVRGDRATTLPCNVGCYRDFLGGNIAGNKQWTWIGPSAQCMDSAGAWHPGDRLRNPCSWWSPAMRLSGRCFRQYRAVWRFGLAFRRQLGSPEARSERPLEVQHFTACGLGFSGGGTTGSRYQGGTYGTHTAAPPECFPGARWGTVGWVTQTATSSSSAAGVTVANSNQGTGSCMLVGNMDQRPGSGLGGQGTSELMRQTVIAKPTPRALL